MCFARNPDAAFLRRSGVVRILIVAWRVGLVIADQHGSAAAGTWSGLH